MQFRGHSLPVHQSMSVSWALFYLVPFRLPISANKISLDYWPLGCVTSFQCIHLQWHVWPGRRSKYNSSSYWNMSLLVTLDYSRQFYFTYLQNVSSKIRTFRRWGSDYTKYIPCRWLRYPSSTNGCSGDNNKFHQVVRLMFWLIGECLTLFITTALHPLSLGPIYGSKHYSYLIGQYAKK